MTKTWRWMALGAAAVVLAGTFRESSHARRSLGKMTGKVAIPNAAITCLVETVAQQIQRQSDLQPLGAA